MAEQQRMYLHDGKLWRVSDDPFERGDLPADGRSASRRPAAAPANDAAGCTGGFSRAAAGARAVGDCLVTA